MNTAQARVPRGVRTAGQFAATVQDEPTVTLQAPEPLPPITQEQADRLRRHRQPVLDAMERRGVEPFTVDTSEADAQVRAIRDRMKRRRG